MLDNIVNWVFEKIFTQLTASFADLYTMPFDEIKERTFDNPAVHQLIHDLTGRSIPAITEALREMQYQFLLKHLKKKAHVLILLDDLHSLTNLISLGYTADQTALELTVINNRLPMLQLLGKSNAKLLMLSAEFSYESIYDYLRSTYKPNLSVYMRAATGTSTKILADIQDVIGIQAKVLSNAFEAGNPDVIRFLVDVALSENVSIDANVIAYAIMNRQIDLVLYLESKNIFQWHSELFYSAILSGSLQMIYLLEDRMPDIHLDRILDTTRCKKKGYQTALTSDMIYRVNNRNYFSHVVNYAVQSGSTEMLQYIISKGYGITASNVLTAIRQNSIEMLTYLIQFYSKLLPVYYIHYFGVNSIVSDKIAKAKVLYDAGMLSFDVPDSVETFKTESVHLKMIADVRDLSTIPTDPDYLLQRSLLFIPEPGIKLDNRLLTITRLALELDLACADKIFEVPNQLATDVLYIYGNPNQIKKYQRMPPSNHILTELICCSNILKLCFARDTLKVLPKLSHLLTVLDDPTLNIFMRHIQKIEPEFAYVLASGKVDKIKACLGGVTLSKSQLKDVLQLGIIPNIDRRHIPELIDWADSMDLLELKAQLDDLIVITTTSR